MDDVYNVNKCKLSCELFFIKKLVRKIIKKVLTNKEYGGKVLLVREIRMENKTKENVDKI